ncbi:MAG: DUF5522 domain-containing protein [Acidimicrobiia bacterium]|nr:DUF5522 domain-containing protein [Acidimicrobiia bacterium]
MDVDLPDDVVAAHKAAIAAGDDGYFDPRTGLFVMTTAYLAARGSCCDSACRHCPYGGTGRQGDDHQS